MQPVVGYVTLTLRLNGPNYPLSAEQQSILVDVVEQLLYSETVIGEVSTISLASMLSSPVADYVEGNAVGLLRHFYQWMSEMMGASLAQLSFVAPFSKASLRRTHTWRTSISIVIGSHFWP